MRSDFRTMAGASIGLGTILVATLMLFSTCQQSKSPSPGHGSSEDATALSGTWVSGCHPDPSKPDFFYTDSRTFGGSDFDTTFASFGDDACKTPQLTQAQVGTFALGDPVTGTDAEELDLTLSSILVTLHTDGLVQAYNDKKFCGGGWEKDKQRQITKAACGGATSPDDAPDMVYEIFAVRDRVLYFGKKDAAHAGKAADQRPNTVDESRPFAKS